MTIFSRSMMLAGMALACALASPTVRADDAGHRPYRLAQTTPIPGGALWQGLAFEASTNRVFFAYGDHVENTGNKRGHGSAGSTGLKMGQSC